MAGIVLQRDVGSLGSLKRLTAEATATAAGSGDASTTTGSTINRLSVGGGSLPNTLEAAIAYDATLTTGKTLSLGYAVQHSPDGSSWTDYQTAASAVVATGSTAASVVSGELQIGVNLSSAYQYVRFNTFQDLSATQTDTSITRGVGFFAGFDRLPQGPG